MDTLVTISEHYPLAALRRLGFLLEKFTETPGLKKFKEACEKRNASTSILDPQWSPVGYLDKNWKIMVNREVFPDV